MNSLLHSIGLPKSSPAQCYTLSFTNQKIGFLACSVYITKKNVGPVWCWSCNDACKRPSGRWKSKNKTGRFPSCLDKTDANLLWQSHCKKEHVHHTAWTRDYSMAPKLFSFSLYLLSFFVWFIWFSCCTVLWWSISHFWYIIIWQNF